MRFPNTWFFFDPYDKNAKSNFTRVTKKLALFFIVTQSSKISLVQK